MLVQGCSLEHALLRPGGKSMSPLDVLIWVGVGAVAIVVLGLAVAIAIGVVIGSKVEMDKRRMRRDRGVE